MKISSLFVVWLLFASPAAAQAPRAKDGLSFDQAFRLRTEFVDWYHPVEQNPNSEYAYHQAKLQLGAKYQSGGFRAYAQGQYFQLIDLPFNGSGPGSVYYSTNDSERNPGDVTLRQLNLSYSSTGDQQAYELLVGRTLYASGSEVAHSDKTVEALKKQRVFNRVLGTFDFTAGRSFDALRGKYGFKEAGVLAGGFMRPTQGGFSTEGSVEIQDIDLGTLSWSLAPVLLPEKTDAQLFWYYYGDGRPDTVKTDNRTLADRKADTDDIRIQNVGAHWIEIFPGEQITGQLLLWGVFQAGDWGTQDVLAGAFALEGGLQFPQLWAKPLVRVGYNCGSGDSDPSDDTRHTFMQMLPTARQYAYAPFYNLMNNEDLFVSTVIEPADRLSILGSLHYLQLANRNDLLYSGGGANLKDRQFGFAGTALSGKSLGLLPELTVSYDLSAIVNLSVYYAHLFSSGSFEDSTGNSNLNYAFAEVNLKY